MFVFWGTTCEDQILDKGFIDCPDCRKRQPAVLTRRVERSHIYFVITTSTIEGPEQLRCDVCGNCFANAAAFAFGNLETMPDWNCFKCKKPIPHARVECPHCGFCFADGSVL